MKYVVLGFPDVDGKGKAKLLLGSEVGVAEQAGHVAKIKASGNFPDGIVRVEFCAVEPHNVAVCTKTAHAAKVADDEARAKRDALLKKNRPELFGPPKPPVQPKAKENKPQSQTPKA